MKTKDELSDRISHFEPADEPRPLPTRLRQAIDRVRWHICGVFGVRESTVTDAHVAQFLLRVKQDYLFRKLPGIGYQSEEDLLRWSHQQEGQL